jgi:hypothetical protein
VVSQVLDSIDVTNHFRNGRPEEGVFAAARIGYQGLGARTAFMACAVFAPAPIIMAGCVAAGTIAGGLAFDAVRAGTNVRRPLVNVPPLPHSTDGPPNIR